MLKVLYISNSFLPSESANSVHVMKMAQAFADCGVQVKLVGRGSSIDLTPEKIMAMYGVAPRFSLHMDFWRWSFLEITRYAACAVIKARLENWDLVYTRLPRAALLSELSGKRAVLELHRPRRSLDVRLYLAFARAPLIVAITEELRAKIIDDLGCDPSRVIVAHDGADPGSENVTPCLPPLPRGRMRVGYLGSLGPGKGMEIIAQIAPHCPWAEFVIVGGSSRAIQSWKEQLGKLPNVFFFGHQPHVSMPGYLASFDVALLPNQNEIKISEETLVDISRWTSPLKAFEYMSAGLATIFSDQKNLREIFTPEVNALACSPNNPLEWISALERLRDDPALRRRLGAAASDTFYQRFTWRKRAQALIDVVSARVLVNTTT